MLTWRFAAIVFILKSVHIFPALCHVILTFPEARYPPFDHLDSVRTLGPCGVPKSSRSQLTDFQSRKIYNVSWRMASRKTGDIHFSLLDANDKLVPNGVQIANGSEAVFSDQLVSGINSRMLIFPLDCQNCTFLLERQAPELGKSALERSCAEVDIRTGELSSTERCSGNGQWSEEVGQCRCQHRFSGEFCQNRDDCASDADCGPDGKCIQDGIVPGQRSCFCQFGFFGVNCERRSDPDPADERCFRHSGPSASAGPDFRYGLFNPDCYQQKELNTEDILYWRLLGNDLELILDFRTNSWLALGWRPLQIPPACRLFPQIHSSEPELAKTSGFARDWLESPLHPMDCTDLVMAFVREGSWLHVADMYSRDTSSPLRDSWLDGEESLSAAYGYQDGERTVVMFRRMVPEIEPTDHPLGPGPVFVIFAKGESKKEFAYHGNGSLNRGYLELEFVPQSEMNRVRGPLIHLDSSEAKAETRTSTAAPKTATLAFSDSTGRLVNDQKGVGSIWVRPKEADAMTTTHESTEITSSTTLTESFREDVADNSLRNQANRDDIPHNGNDAGDHHSSVEDGNAEEHQQSVNTLAEQWHPHGHRQHQNVIEEGDWDQQGEMAQQQNSSAFPPHQFQLLFRCLVSIALTTMLPFMFS